MMTFVPARVLLRCVLAAAALVAAPLAVIAHEEGPSAPTGPLGGEDFEASNVILRGRISLQEFDLGGGADCWGYTSPSGREYALMGFTRGVSFVEITDPAQPQIVASFDAEASLWADVKVFGHYAYFTKDRANTGLQIFDMSQIDDGVVTKIGEWRDDGYRWAHNIAIHEETGFLYLCGANTPTNGLVALDISDPTQPQLAGSYDDFYVHDAQIVVWPHEGPWQGREIAFCFAAEAGIDIVDVTDKSNMTRIARVTYPGLQYSHQGWVDVERRVLFQNDELDERNGVVPSTTTRVWDVTNLASPDFLGSFTSGLPAIDHNLYVRDGFVYEANYQSGMRIFDARKDPANAVEVGFFDTFPGGDSDTFDGAWSVYPYYKSGNVIISDINRGLFVVDPWFALNGGVPAAFDYPEPLPELLPPTGASVEVRIEPANGQALDYAQTTFTYHIHPRPGQHHGAYTTLPAEDLGPAAEGGRLFRLNFPDLPCGEMAHYYITAVSAEGTQVHEPLAAPVIKHPARIADVLDETFHDDMETDRGWVVGAPGDTATTGIWERVVPVASAAQVGEDNPDGEGTMCWVTENGLPNGPNGAADVDGGATTLTSPALPILGDGYPVLSYYFAYSNNVTTQIDDTMPVLVSPDGGQSWTEIELVSEPTYGWARRVVYIHELFEDAQSVTLRFVARDEDAGSVVEAAVDDVRLEMLRCLPRLDGDANTDGVVNFADLNIVLNAFGAHSDIPGEFPADLNRDGAVDFVDLNMVLNTFGEHI